MKKRVVIFWEKLYDHYFLFRYLDFRARYNIMDLKITTDSSTSASNIKGTLSFKIIWKKLDSARERADVLTYFSTCTNGLCLCKEQRQDKFEISETDEWLEDSRNFYF